MLPVSQRELKNLTAICIFGAAEDTQETSGRSFWDSEVKLRRGIQRGPSRDGNWVENRGWSTELA